MTHRGPFQPLLFCDSVILCSPESCRFSGCVSVRARVTQPMVGVLLHPSACPACPVSVLLALGPSGAAAGGVPNSGLVCPVCRTPMCAPSRGVWLRVCADTGVCPEAAALVHKPTAIDALCIAIVLFLTHVPCDSVN